jgi:hypothetical protein
MPDRDVFYVADHISSIETRSFPNSLAATLATLPSMSLIPQLHSRGHNAQQDRAELERCIVESLQDLFSGE